MTGPTVMRLVPTYAGTPDPELVDSGSASDESSRSPVAGRRRADAIR